MRCGAGTDSATLDAIDDPGTECETTDVLTPADRPDRPRRPGGRDRRTGAAGGDRRGRARPARDRRSAGPADRRDRRDRPQRAATPSSPARRKVKGKAAKVTVTCSVKLAAAAPLSVRASFKRGDRVVAAASGVRHSGGEISLRDSAARSPRGRYNLVLTFTVDGAPHDRHAARPRRLAAPANVNCAGWGGWGATGAAAR